MKEVLQLPAFSTSALNSTAISTVPVKTRDTYHTLFVRVAGQGYGASGTPLDIKHALDEVAVEVNGRDMLVASPFGLRQLQEYTNTNRDVPQPGILAIPLSSPGFSLSDWPVAALESFKVKAKTKASLPANSSGNPTLTLTAVTGVAVQEQLPDLNPLGSVFTFRRAHHTGTVAGWNTIENLPVGDILRLRHSRGHQAPVHHAHEHRARRRDCACQFPIVVALGATGSKRTNRRRRRRVFVNSTATVPANIPSTT